MHASATGRSPHARPPPPGHALARFHATGGGAPRCVASPAAPRCSQHPPPKKEEGEKCGRFHDGPASGGVWHLCAGLPVPNTTPTASRPDGALLASTRGAGRTRGRAAASGNVPLFDSSALARVSGSVSRATCVGGRSRGALTRPCRPSDAYVGFLRAPAGSLQGMAALCRSPLALRAPPALRAPSALARAVLCAALWALCAAALASARALPGHSGMIPVDGTKDGHIFYWYFPPREPAAADGGASPTPTPLVLWMTGGPGCSSELALFKVGLAPANPGTRAGCRPASWRQPACTLSVLLACRACIQRSAGAAGNRVGC